MTQEEKDNVLHGAKFEMMNRCIDFNDGTVDREKMLNAMQRYAEMYHDNELSKLRQHDVIRWVSFCEELPNEGDDIVIFEDGYGAWSCKFEFDKDANYSKSVWCFQPCV